MSGFLSRAPYWALGTWLATQASALTGNRTCDLLVYRPALNPLSCVAPLIDADIWLIFILSLTQDPTRNLGVQGGTTL